MSEPDRVAQLEQVRDAFVRSYKTLVSAAHEGAEEASRLRGEHDETKQSNGFPSREEEASSLSVVRDTYEKAAANTSSVAALGADVSKMAERVLDIVRRADGNRDLLRVAAQENAESEDPVDVGLLKGLAELDTWWIEPANKPTD